jgi:hypothetical protein
VIEAESFIFVMLGKSSGPYTQCLRKYSSAPAVFSGILPRPEATEGLQGQSHRVRVMSAITVCRIRKVRRDRGRIESFGNPTE